MFVRKISGMVAVIGENADEAGRIRTASDFELGVLCREAGYRTLVRAVRGKIGTVLDSQLYGALVAAGYDVQLCGADVSINGQLINRKDLR